MLARDQPPDPENPYRNLYGVHPFYLGLEKDNNAHGVLLWNSNPQVKAFIVTSLLWSDRLYVENLK